MKSARHQNLRWEYATIPSPQRSPNADGDGCQARRTTVRVDSLLILTSRFCSVPNSKSESSSVGRPTDKAGASKCSANSRSVGDAMISFRAAQMLLLLGVLNCAAGEEGYCAAPVTKAQSNSQPLYWKVTNPTLSPAHLQDLPGFTRSVIKRDHALITPESHVFSPLPDWTNTLGAYLITPAMGSHFVMYLANMQENSKSALPPQDVERFLFVVSGTVALSTAPQTSHNLHVDSYAYLPPNFGHFLRCDTAATLVIFERRHASLESQIPEFIVGSTDKQPLLETPGEVFQLRKLLPTSVPYDFNIHIMDFQPGEYLNVKEVHYNQHGLLLLEGQGIYRLGDNWYPVQAGDSIWMAPFVPQWYAALGKTRSRYLLYKDVNRNPLNS